MTHPEPIFWQASAAACPLRDESVDLIVSDPPFGINYTGIDHHYMRRHDHVLDSYKEIDEDTIYQAVAEMHRCLKERGSLWIIMGWNTLRHWENACADRGFHQIGHVIWKFQFGMRTSRKPVSSHYHLLIYTKHPKRWTWNKQGYDEDVWIVNRPYVKGGVKYPNKLPEEIARRAIVRSSNPGDVVYDPFCGSGTIPKVACALGRIGLGGDLRDNRFFWKDLHLIGSAVQANGTQPILPAP